MRLDRAVDEHVPQPPERPRHAGRARYEQAADDFGTPPLPHGRDEVGEDDPRGHQEREALGEQRKAGDNPECGARPRPEVAGEDPCHEVGGSRGQEDQQVVVVDGRFDVRELGDDERCRRGHGGQWRREPEAPRGEKQQQRQGRGEQRITPAQEHPHGVKWLVLPARDHGHDGSAQQVVERRVLDELVVVRLVHRCAATSPCVGRALAARRDVVAVGEMLLAGEPVHRDEIARLDALGDECGSGIRPRPRLALSYL
jgi:hypothetical protein